MKNLRMWMADILIGKTPYIKGVTFYQTVCLDMDAGVYIKNCKVNLNHGIDWKIKTDGYCFNFNYYEKYISAKEQQEKHTNATLRRGAHFTAKGRKAGTESMKYHITNTIPKRPKRDVQCVLTQWSAPSIPGEDINPIRNTHSTPQVGKSKLTVFDR